MCIHPLYYTVFGNQLQQNKKVSKKRLNPIRRRQQQAQQNINQGNSPLNRKLQKQVQCLHYVVV